MSINPQTIKDIAALSSYKELKEVIEEINNFSKVKSSAKLSKQLGDALTLHQELQKEFPAILEDIEEMKQEILELRHSQE